MIVFSFFFLNFIKVVYIDNILIKKKMISGTVNSLTAYAQTSWLGPEGNNSRESRETSVLSREIKTNWCCIILI